MGIRSYYCECRVVGNWFRLNRSEHVRHGPDTLYDTRRCSLRGMLLPTQVHGFPSAFARGADWPDAEDCLVQKWYTSYLAYESFGVYPE